MSDLPTTPSEPFKDLNSHQELLDELQNATNEVLNAASEVIETREEVQNHNLDSSAHPDIRRLINDATSGSTETIDTRISDHNVSVSAHQDIRVLIDSVRNDTTTAVNVVNEALATHNTSDTAHSDIRESINNLKNNVGSINLTEVVTRVTTLEDRLDGEITEDVEALQSVDARHDNEISTNRNNITSLSSRLSNISSDVVTVANTVTGTISDIDELALKTHCLDREEVLGYTQFNETGPDLVNMSTTLPIYVSHNKTTSFIITDVVDSADGDSVTMSITQGVGDYTISPLEGINPGDTINMNVGSGGQPGDILDFTVTFTDTTTSQTVQRVLAVMIAKPLGTGVLTLNGLPTNVEPGQHFTIQVSNLVDDGSGRYTYSIDVMTSGITFSKTSDISEADAIEVDIPAGAERETELTFKLIVHDNFGSDQEYEFSVMVNALPSTEGFTHTVPGTVVPGNNYTIKFDGILSAQGNKANYNIVETDDGILTFSKYDDILANENVIMTVSAEAVRGQEYTFKINTMDENDVSVQLTVAVAINILPLSNDITTTLPANTQGGKTLAFKISGGSDTEQPLVNEGSGRTVVSYDIDAGDSSFNFSKITGISSNDEITVVIPKVAADTDRTFNIYAVDDLGERSASPKIVSIQVNPIYLPVTPTITSPSNGAELEDDEGIDITWTEFSYSTDMRSANEVVYTFDR